MKPDPICTTKQNFRFANEGERDFEKKRIDEIPYTNLCWVFFLCLMLLSLAVPFFFFLLSISLLCVCTCSLFVYLPSFFCVCSPIYKGIEKQFSPFFAPNWSIHGAVWVSFSSTIPNFMVNRAPLFALFR